MLKRNKILFVVVLLITVFVVNCKVNDNEAVSKQLFDLNWKFYRSNSNSASEVEFDDKNWQKIDLPHLCSNNSDSIDTCWYRKHFVVPENWINKNIVIYFEGISELNEVWVNGNSVVNSLKEKNTFQANINSYITSERNNIIAVRISRSNRQNDASPKGSGIIKHVWLVITDPSEYK